MADTAAQVVYASASKSDRRFFVMTNGLHAASGFSHFREGAIALLGSVHEFVSGTQRVERALCGSAQPLIALATAVPTL